MRRIFAVMAATALAACGADGPDLTGNWLGSLEGQCAPIVNLEIEESDRGTITGSALISTPVSCGLSALSYSVVGDHDGASVEMVLTPSLGNPTSGARLLSGTVRGADAIDATLNGEPLTLLRQ